MVFRPTLLHMIFIFQHNPNPNYQAFSLLSLEMCLTQSVVTKTSSPFSLFFFGYLLIDPKSQKSRAALHSHVPSPTVQLFKLLYWSTITTNTFETQKQKLFSFQKQQIFNQ